MTKYSLINVIDPQACNGEGNDDEVEICCSEDNPCKEGEGDCDINRDCFGDLVCGSNNCDPNRFSQDWMDCCMKGKLWRI